MSTYIIAIVILTLFSGLFSATETAYSSSSKIRLKNMANDGNTKASSVLVILDDFDKFLTSVLIGNNIVNIASATKARRTAPYPKSLGRTTPWC